MNSPYNNQNLKVQIPYFSPNKVKTSYICKEEDFFKPNIAKCVMIYIINIEIQKLLDKQDKKLYTAIYKKLEKTK